VIAAQLQTQGLGNALAREIILRGAEASGKNHDLGTRKCNPARLQQMLDTIADNGLEYDFHAKFVEALGQEQGVCILAEGRQELGADSYDLSIHSYQCKPNGPRSRTFHCIAIVSAMPGFGYERTPAWIELIGVSKITMSLDLGH
jgi:hypothetical protein